MKEHDKNAIKAASFVVFGYGFSQVIRLAGNIILTRLLVPEFFGLMALCNVFLQGLHLFSDIGIEIGVIRSPRSNDESFLNTAWTIQVIRGIAIFLISILISYPVSLIYEDSRLAILIPVICFSSVLRGFQATSYIILSKELKQGKITLLELFVQIISLSIMVVLAYFFRSIWSMVIGSLIAALLKSFLSHLLIRNVHNRFKWEKPSVHEILSFGKWIFLSTAMMFLATQADRLILGKIFPIALFGIYNIAVIFAELPKQIIGNLSQKVLYPLVTKYIQQSREDFRNMIERQRRVLIYPLATLVALLSSFGDYVILFLYDQRYSQASWILPLLALGIWPLILHSTNDRSLFALGKPNYSAFGNTLKFIYMIVCLPLFFSIGGNIGAVLAVVLNDIPVYIIVNIGLRKERLSLFKQDAIATLFLLLIVALCIAVRLHFGLGFPGEFSYVS